MPSFRELLIVDLDRSRFGFGEVGGDAVLLRSPTCGDEMRLEVRLDGESGSDPAGPRVRSLVWNGHGCTVSMASASALAALAPGMSVAALRELHAEFSALVQGPVPSIETPDEPPDESGADSGASPRLGDAVVFAGIGRLPLRGGCATLAWRALDALLPQ